jgi:cation diffusion facilitator family transporter
LGKIGIRAAAFGFAANLILFAVKLYVGLSSGSLAIYCDSVNNLADTLSCVIAGAGFFLVTRLDEKRGARVQALASFVIGLAVALTGAYLVWQGLERLMYPTPVAYTGKYALLILATVFVKLAMGAAYLAVYRKNASPVIKTLYLDSFLDCGITLCALMSFWLISTVNFAVDGIASVAIGAIIAVGAARTVIEQAKHLINE